MQLNHRLNDWSKLYSRVLIRNQSTCSLQGDFFIVQIPEDLDSKKAIRKVLFSCDDVYKVSLSFPLNLFLFSLLNHEQIHDSGGIQLETRR